MTSAETDRHFLNTITYTPVNEPTTIDTTAKPPLIHSRISAVMADIQAVGKNKKNREQGYSFRAIDDFYDALQPALLAHKVFITPTILEHSRETRPTKSGGILMTTLTKVRFRLWTEDGSYIEADALGEGADSGDKSANKAAAGAMKYLFMQVFCVRVSGPGDDSEHQSHEYAPKQDAPEAEPLSPQSIRPQPTLESVCKSKFLKRLKELGLENSAARLFCDTKVIGPNDGLDDIPANRCPQTKEDFDSVIAEIQKVQAETKADDQLPGAEVPVRPASWGGLPAEPESMDAEGNRSITGYIVTTNSKETKKKGTFRYGICIKQSMNGDEQGLWINTFSKQMFEQAGTLSGKKVEAKYSTSKFGADLVSIGEVA